MRLTIQDKRSDIKSYLRGDANYKPGDKLNLTLSDEIYKTRVKIGNFDIYDDEQKKYYITEKGSLEVIAVHNSLREATSDIREKLKK